MNLNSSLSDLEATHYYAGLPSRPRLVARTGTTPWAKPTGLEAYFQRKELGVVYDHKLNTTVWEHDIAPKVVACLDEMRVLWTSIDVVRIGVVGESTAPVILWIGVTPKSLVAGSEDANTAASRCLDILKVYGITDVEVELRESLIIRSTGPKLLSPVISSNPTAAVRTPLTHTLSLPISPKDAPYVGGTGGFYMAEGGDSKELFLITARHVVLPWGSNEEFDHKRAGQHRCDILLLGDKAYQNCLESIQGAIDDYPVVVEDSKRRLKAVEGLDDKWAHVEREEAEVKIKAAKDGQVITELNAFYNDINKYWATHDSRVLGHVAYSPPICFGAGTTAEQHTQDYAVIQVDRDKINWTEFKGNVIDLGTKIERLEFTKKMRPKNCGQPSFEYPSDRMLRLHGIISDEDMRHPTSLDKDGKKCTMVLKDGSGTGVTIGRASGIKSIVRYYVDNDELKTANSMEWVILPYDNESGPFSDSGDSGAAIVDSHGHIGGLLTGGGGDKNNVDVTYATPITFIKNSIKRKYPDAHLDPV